MLNCYVYLYSWLNGWEDRPFSKVVKIYFFFSLEMVFLLICVIWYLNVIYIGFTWFTPWNQQLVWWRECSDSSLRAICSQPCTSNWFSIKRDWFISTHKTNMLTLAIIPRPNTSYLILEIMKYTFKCLGKSNVLFPYVLCVVKVVTWSHSWRSILKSSMCLASYVDIYQNWIVF